jgi:ferredoxin
MSFFINQDCISCDACVPECPNQAISAGNPVYIINPERCTECVGSFDLSRCAAVCPVDACHPDPNNHENRDQLLNKYRGLHPGQEPKPGTF